MSHSAWMTTCATRITEAIVNRTAARYHPPRHGLAELNELQPNGSLGPLPQACAQGPPTPVTRPAIRWFWDREVPCLPGMNQARAPWQCLYLLPDPQGHRALRLIGMSA